MCFFVKVQDLCVLVLMESGGQTLQNILSPCYTADNEHSDYAKQLK